MYAYSLISASFESETENYPEERCFCTTEQFLAYNFTSKAENPTSSNLSAHSFHIDVTMNALSVCVYSKNSAAYLYLRLRNRGDYTSRHH